MIEFNLQLKTLAPDLTQVNLLSESVWAALREERQIVKRERERKRVDRRAFGVVINLAIS